MMFPILVTRSIMEVNGNKLSVVFTATFVNGENKMLRDVRKNNGVVKPCEIGAENSVILCRDETPLYNLDWSETPVFGSFKKNYPKR